MALLIDDLFNFRVTLAQGLKIAHYSLIFTIMNVQSMKGLSIYEGFCQGMKGLSIYEGFFKVWMVCQDMKGLSSYEGFVKI